MTSTCLAVDLGGSRVRVALVHCDVNNAGKLQCSVEWRRSEATINRGKPSEVVDQIAQMIGSDLPHNLLGIAVAAPGPLDTTDGVVLRIPTLYGWHNVHLKEMLLRRFQLPVVIENDAIAAAVGQWRFGVAKAVDSLVYLTISTGIGGGIISDGRIVRGKRGFAGHIGHLLLYPESTQQCACGRYGCFEAYASGTALDKLAKQVVSQGSAECRALWKSMNAEQSATAAHLGRAAAAGHKPSLAIWHNQGRYLAQGICTLVHMLNPQMVVLGGGVSNCYEWFAPEMKRRLQDLLMPEFSDVVVKQADAHDDAGMVGVASLLFDTL